MTDESKPQIVDQYTLIIEERGGFPMVVLRFLTSDMQSHAFELHPAFAHALSDELLQTCAHAMPKTSK